MKTNKIVIKTIWGSVLWESEKETIAEAVKEKFDRDANLYGADLCGADLRGADLRGADLRGANFCDVNFYGADLCGADLRGADLRGADLRGADLRGADLYGANLYGADLRGADLYGANLYGADLRGANLKKLPTDFINQCSRDILFILQSLKSEVPLLREKLIAGEIDGSQYAGECACLVGTLAKAKNVNVEKTCEYIPFYEKGTHNAGEQWFLNIRQGDTPENNQFAAHVLMLIDYVLEGKPLIHPHSK